jgi:hypothetical protein
VTAGAGRDAFGRLEEEVAELRERCAEDRKQAQAARAATAALWRNVAIAYLILMIGAAGGLYALERRDIKRTDDAALRSCARVNVLRTALNDNALVLYLATKVGAEREESLAKVGPDKAVHKASAEANRAIQAKYKFRPLTNCHAAVFDPDHYRPPAPRPFTQAQLDTIKLPPQPQAKG